MGSILCSNLAIAKDDKSLTSPAAMSDVEHYSMSMVECPGATNCYTQLGLPDKERKIKRLVVCNGLCLCPLDLLKDLAPRILTTVS